MDKKNQLVRLIESVVAQMITEQDSEISAGEISRFLNKLRNAMTPLVKTLEIYQKNEDGSYKESSDINNREHQVLKNLEEELIGIISIHNIFSASLGVFQVMLGRKPEKTSLKSKFASFIKKGLTEVTEPVYNPLGKKELIPLDQISTVAQEIYNNHQEDFDAIIPPFKTDKESISSTLPIPEIISVVSKNIGDEYAIGSHKAMEPQKLFVELQEAAERVSAKMQAAPRDKTIGMKEVAEIIKKDYPNLSDATINEIALQIHNDFSDRPTQDQLVGRAKGLKVADDAFVLMGFATYYYGRAQLYPINMGIDIVQQAIFKDMRKNIPPRITNLWPDIKLLAKTNFGKIYKEIPEKMKTYGDLARPATAWSGPDLSGFLDSVIKRENLSEDFPLSIKGAIKNVLNRRLSDISGARQKMIPKMISHFMTDEDADPLGMTKSIVELFKEIKQSRPPSVPPSGPPSPRPPRPRRPRRGQPDELVIGQTDENNNPILSESSPESAQMRQFLAKITGEQDMDKVDRIISTLHDSDSVNLENYLKISNGLKLSDPHCIALLNHIYKHLDDIVNLDFSPSPTTEQKIMETIHVIIEKLLKEENGKKELCN